MKGSGSKGSRGNGADCMVGRGRGWGRRVGGQRRAHQVIRGIIVIDLKINDKESIYYLYNTVHELVG